LAWYSIIVDTINKKSLKILKGKSEITVVDINSLIISVVMIRVTYYIIQFTKGANKSHILGRRTDNTMKTKKKKTTNDGQNSGSGNAHPSGAPEFTPGF
jgi:hypothetical protein